ncbi:uncharacterized protein LOC119642934 isoform X3 [Glossina fuscipes]|uniref:Uncharacterized protein LOC119642934 isoform X3 n=1 Tax=Glossina fuscipes TaxID=7396 RepID=A0A9C5ZGB3_9MUSC|nr:uncharacterized protein LOC119642934 isoform X3 [Glossina fuscipes]
MCENFPAHLITLIKLTHLVFANALRDVRVQVPAAVRRGEKAILKCLYDLEGDNLYSVKWYKGRREFYSYTPKETPAMKVFQFSGVKVERSSSNESQLVLDTVNAATTGKYSCEVSADAPSFHTLISAGDLEVVVVPGKEPIITGIKSRYHVGDIIRGNCTSAHSRPAANITWTINGYETNPSYVRQHKPIKDLRDLETVISGIHFVVTPQHFIRGKLKIRCTAHIHDVYWKSTEKSIEEDRQVARPNEVNLINSFSDDYFDLEDEDDNENDDVRDRSAHITHIKGDMSSLNANGSTAAHFATCLRLWPHLTTLPFLWYALQEILQLLRQLFGQQQITNAKIDNGLNRKVNKHSKHNIHYQQQKQQVEQHISRTTAKATAANSQATLSYLLKWLQRKQKHSQANNNKKEN